MTGSSAVILIAIVVVAAGVWRYLTVTRLKREMRLFRAMVEQNQDLISIISADGRLTYVNGSSRSFLGRPPEEMVGTHITEYVHPDDREMVSGQWTEVLAEEGKVLRTPEFRLIRSDGVVVYAETVGCNMLHDPAVGGVLATTHDVTERHGVQETLRLAEDQFRRSQKMEAVGRLAGGIAHDFNNLLTAIQGYTRLLLDDDRLEPSMRADLEQVQLGAERAATLTRQLLAFSQRQLVQPHVIDLNHVVTGIRAMLTGLVHQRVTTSFDLSPQTGSVRADRGQLEQVLVNLVMNAVDAMPSGGSLRIATRSAHVTPEEAAAFRFDVAPGDYAEIVVTDTGTGIPDDVMPNIFEPFFTTKPQGKGTGLGLSTVYGIVKQSGGYVFADSRTGVGTTMRVCLPRAGAGGAAAATSAGSALGGGETILVIEDEDGVRRLTTRVLQRAGYNVMSAADGEAALALSAAFAGSIDLILTDVVMPGMNGRQVVDRLREERPDVPALYASGYTRDAIVEQGFVEPGIDFIEKPFSPDALLKKVRAVLAASRP